MELRLSSLVRATLVLVQEFDQIDPTFGQLFAIGIVITAAPHDAELMQNGSLSFHGILPCQMAETLLIAERGGNWVVPIPG
jgi:hypothetical protein